MNIFSKVCAAVRSSGVYLSFTLAGSIWSAFLLSARVCEQCAHAGMSAQKMRVHLARAYWAVDMGRAGVVGVELISFNVYSI